ncbi:MAG: hypothetical protein HY763_17165, partial [Planctomycetes bacterium]|nr:hypothetical protein [Planctomycetota bacterium]
PLHRLAVAERGKLSGNSDALDQAATRVGQAWSMDVLGNWVGVDAEGLTQYVPNAAPGLDVEAPTATESHLTDSANRMRRRVLDADGAGGGGTTIVNHANDAAGNLLLTAAHFFTYDPWNRAIEVREKGTLSGNLLNDALTGTPGALVTRIEYDALGRRIAESLSSDANAGPTDYFYYDGNRVIEHATAPSGNPPPPPPPQEYSLRLDPAPHDVGTADTARDAVMHPSADDSASARPTLAAEISDGDSGSPRRTGSGSPTLVPTSGTIVPVHERRPGDDQPPPPPPIAPQPGARLYVYGVDDFSEIVAFYDDPANPAAEPWYVIQDANSNVTGVFDSNGTPAEQYAYTPYGLELATENGSGVPLAPAAPRALSQRFQGMWLHPTLGVYVSTSGRLYDPRIGRWLQRDPNETALLLASVMRSRGQMASGFARFSPGSQYIDGANLYQFVYSGPINHTDPSGLSADIWDEVGDIAAEYYAGRAMSQAALILQAQGLARRALARGAAMGKRLALEIAASTVWQPAPYAFAVYDAGQDLYTMYEHGVNWDTAASLAMSLYGAKAAAGAAAGMGAIVRVADLDWHTLKYNLRYGLASERSGARREFRGGPYRAIKGGGYHAHHMPAQAAWTKAGKSVDNAPAIQLEDADHYKTASYGGGPRGDAYRSKQAELIKAGRWREALQVDVNDIRTKFGDKYDAAIVEMMDYVDSEFRP